MYEPINKSSLVDDGMYEVASYHDTFQKGNVKQRKKACMTALTSDKEAIINLS